MTAGLVGFQSHRVIRGAGILLLVAKFSFNRFWKPRLTRKGVDWFCPAGLPRPCPTPTSRPGTVTPKPRLRVAGSSPLQGPSV